MLQIEDQTNDANQETSKIPNYLIRDEFDGRSFYYKGYKEVLNKSKTLEDIMPSSGLQSEIIMYLFAILLQQIGIKKYRIYASESGNHIKKKLNYGLDVAVYDRAILSSDKVNDKYVSVPPELVIEVDIKVDTVELTEEEFILSKTQSLLDSGCKKVIWIISKKQKVLLAEPNKDWLIRDWDKEFDLMNGVIANVGKYLKDNGIDVNN